MFWTILSNAFILFALCLIQVSISTLRTIMITRGKRIWAALLGFIEVSGWVIGLSQIIGHLDNVWNVMGYSGGRESCNVAIVPVKPQIIVLQDELMGENQTAGSQK